MDRSGLYGTRGKGHCVLTEKGRINDSTVYVCTTSKKSSDQIRQVRQVLGPGSWVIFFKIIFVNTFPFFIKNSCDSCIMTNLIKYIVNHLIVPGSCSKGQEGMGVSVLGVVWAEA